MRINGSDDLVPITGAEFLRKCDKMDDKWISDTTGWALTEIMQIKTVLLRHSTQQHADILRIIERNYCIKALAIN